MTLTIERLRPGRGKNDIKITRTHPDKPIEYIFMTQEALEELVFFASWYGVQYGGSCSKTALGCFLEPGEATHVG